MLSSIRNVKFIKMRKLKMFITAACVLFLKKLKYFGHLKRSKGLGNIILMGKIDGKRERGRPRR